MGLFSNLPFSGDHPIVQQFGDSPRTFGRVRYADTILRGHHGVDFGMPVGESVYAVAEATVAAAAEDRDGFGLYVLLQHHWGQTLYAHLSDLDVVSGDKVAAGSSIGRSGDSGLCLKPHLHFGLRVNPYSLHDRWCGYTDPMPYLHRVFFGRGPVVGPHIITNVPHHLKLLQRWQPRLITILEPNPDEVRDLRHACPNSVIVGRIVPPEGDLTERIVKGPREAAHWAHEKTLPHLSTDVDYYQIANEDLQDTTGLPLLNEFELERMRLAEASGYACALFGLGVGNPYMPREDRMARWRQLYTALARAETHGHIVAVHQYGMPDLWGPHGRFDWYVFRLEHQVLRRLPFKHLRFAVTETGINGLITGDEPSGWTEFTNEADYVRQLLKSGRYVERYSGRLLGTNVFTLGHSPPWHSYEIEGKIAQTLAHASGRGRWVDVDTNVRDIQPADFKPSQIPGAEALPDVCPHNALAAPLPSKEVGSLSYRRLDARFYSYHMEIKSVCERPDLSCDGSNDSSHSVDGQSQDIVYVIKDVFMTVDGSWKIDGSPGNVPLWARKDYLTPEFQEAGAARHLFGAVVGLDGELVRNSLITYWSDGFELIGDPDYSDYITMKVRPESGWAHMILSGSSAFDPDRGESGPWCWMPGGMAEVITGGGLPLNHHVSTFVVWQAVRREEWEREWDRNGVNNLPHPGMPHPVPRRVSYCAPHFGLSIQRLTRFTPTPDNKPAYVVRDLFTVFSDEEYENPGLGACPDWALQDYAVPIPKLNGEDGQSAPARMYAGVRNEQGFLVPAQEITFVRGDFDALRNGAHNERNQRNTAADTGWAHLDLEDEDVYAPARGQSGPWCWAPTGAAEAVCGAGLPDGKRVSIFAVWEAVPPIS